MPNMRGSLTATSRATRRSSDLAVSAAGAQRATSTKSSGARRPPVRPSNPASNTQRGVGGATDLRRARVHHSTCRQLQTTLSARAKHARRTLLSSSLLSSLLPCLLFSSLHCTLPCTVLLGWSRRTLSMQLR